MEAINEMMTCVVKLKYSQLDAGSIADVSAIKKATVQRRNAGTTTWFDLRSILIVTANDLDFTLVDLTARSHETYEYRVVLNDGTTDRLSQVLRVSTDFRSILVANATDGYVCLGNPKYTSQRQHNIAYVKPYNSRYPHSVKNGVSNYSAGTIEGYFNPLNDQCQIEMVYSEFSDALLDFLTDGLPKVIKIPDGHIWYVQIDPQVKLDNDGVVGICKASFSWTEIGEVPFLTYIGANSPFIDAITDEASNAQLVIDEVGNATLKGIDIVIDASGNMQVT